MLAGLARDGGLYVPNSWPQLRPAAIAAFAGRPFAEVAASVLAPFAGAAIPHTELLALAERQGYRIKDIPIIWIEDDDSRVKIVRTAWDDIKGVLRLRWQFWRGDFAQAPASEATRKES